MTYDTCSAEWLATADNQTNAYYVIIIFITLLATVSVLTGLDRGIMTLASAAFTCGLVVLFTVMFSDNTWYLLSIMVQVRLLLTHQPTSPTSPQHPSPRLPTPSSHLVALSPPTLRLTSATRTRRRPATTSRMSSRSASTARPSSSLPSR